MEERKSASINDSRAVSFGSGDDSLGSAIFAALRNLVELSSPTKLAVLIGGMIAAAIAELIGISVILTLTSAVVNIGNHPTSASIAKLQTWTGIADERKLIAALCILSIFLIILVNALNLAVTWIVNGVTWHCGHQLALRLFSTYLAWPYANFLRANTSDLTKNLFVEVSNVIVGVLIPSAMLIARSLVMAALLIGLIVIDWRVALLVFVILGGAYAAALVMLKPIVIRFGASAEKARKEAHLVASEALGGIKDVRLQGLEAFMKARFSQPLETALRNDAMCQVLGTAPRYLLEIIASGGMIAIAGVLVSNNYPSNFVAPLLATYAFAGFRLLPVMQYIYYSLTQVRYHSAALQLIMREFKSPEFAGPSIIEAISIGPGRLVMEDVSFVYPGTTVHVLKDVNFVLAPGSSIAITGSTGSGKTTFIDLMVGLLQATSGKVLIDGQLLTPKLARAWQANIGYVSQSVYLKDGTIATNIAFGFPDEEIDMERVREAARLANLHEVIEETLPLGYDTPVGERGSRLSGGQRQRVALARALYRRPSVLVLDEPTSALDENTEEQTMQAIHGLSGKLTIIIVAHRLNTINACDAIYEMQDGKLLFKAQGKSRE